MRRLSIVLICTLLVMTSCAPKQNDEVVQDEKEKQKISIVPSYQLSKENYRMILPYKPSAARGIITDQIVNRVDIDEVEQGLRRHSKDYFDPETYYFREGQFLTSETVYAWLKRKLTKEELEKEVQDYINWLKKNEMTINDQVEKEKRQELQLGLNPPIHDESQKKQHEESPRYLSHIVEQNFLLKKENKNVQVAGISIGLAMKSVYRYQTEIGGPYFYKEIPEKKMLEEGNKIAQTVVNRLRKMDGLSKVPIMLAIYREEEQGSPIPGRFVSKTLVDKGQTKLGKWESIDEEHILFPSRNAQEKYFEDSEVVNKFANDVAEYFPNYVGLIGRGFYVNGELNHLILDIPLEFYGKGEIIGFTQYAFGLAKEIFSNRYDLEINIQSSDQMESVIYRESGQKEPKVHIFQ